MLYKLIYIFFCLFFLSCNFDDEPIAISDIDQHELKYRKFVLNSDSSYVKKELLTIGESSLLYLGKINEDDYTYTLFGFDNDIFQNYDLCDRDSLSYKDLYLVIDLINEYELSNQNINYDIDNNFSFDIPLITAYWLDFSDLSGMISDSILVDNWLESTPYSFDNIDIDLNLFNEDKKLFLDRHAGKYYISLSEKLIQNYQLDDCINLDENSCKNSNFCNWSNESCTNISNDIKICDNDYNNQQLLLIASNSNFLYEFASSDYTSDYSNTEPYLNIVFDEYEISTKNSNRFILGEVNNNLGSSLFIADTLLNNYNYIFLGDEFENYDNNQITDSVIWSDQNIINPLIYDDLLNQDLDLMEIYIRLINTDNFDSSGVSFSLDNIKYLSYTSDPSNDNWSELDTTGTEGNNQWDVGEYFEDYGLDLCNNIFEDSYGGCVEDSTLSIYNINGTENNYSWDQGESYEDFGLDGCPDQYEDSLGECLCNYPNGCDDIVTVCLDDDSDGLCDDGLDPNSDNYNNDPSQDDWFDTNNNGEWDQNENLENNGQRDDNEPFLDIGLDGLDSLLVGYSDFGENNGEYDFGEPFFDTGIDSLFTIDEVGYNISGYQNDGLYQFGEPFDDCGTDMDCFDNDTSDDYNIDPNKDNWSDCGSDTLCPNDPDYIEPDSDGSELNGLWDVNEGTELNNNFDSLDGISEFYEDYGSDQLQDQDELMVFNQKISVSNTDITFYDYLNQTVDNYPNFNNQDNDSLKVWISSIETVSDDSLKVSIKASSLKEIIGIEFRLNHEIYSSEVTDWVNKERNVAKVDYESYIKDYSIFNNSVSPYNDSLYLNYAYGISTLLNFDGLNTFINDNPGIILNENNSFLKIFLDKDNDNLLLESDNYIINFNESDGETSLFSYYSINNPDSLVIPIGNLIQQYINNQSSYKEGVLIKLDPNQYPPNFNFNNIVFDIENPPTLELYYFK